MYCSKCGKENSDDSKFCYGCGAELIKHSYNNDIETRIENLEKQEKERVAENYNNNNRTFLNQIKKLNIVTLLSHALIVSTVLIFIFAPIYQCTHEASLDDIETLEQFEEALVNGGKINKNFSLFDDILHIWNGFNENKNSSYRPNSSITETEIFKVILVMIIPIGECILSIFLICKITPKIWHQICDYNAGVLDTTYYTNKISDKSIKNDLIAIFVCSILDVFLTSKTDPNTYEIAEYTFLRNMVNFSGISPWIIMLFAVIVALIILSLVSKALEKNIDILLNDFNK